MKEMILGSNLQNEKSFIDTVVGGMFNGCVKCINQYTFNCLQSIWNILFKTSSCVERGTLYQLRNLIK